MKSQLLNTLLFGSILIAVNTHAQEARELITKVVDANGGTKALDKLKDVRFDYTFKVSDSMMDVSTERYIFEGEASYGIYSQRQVFALPQMTGVHSQYYNGTSTISLINKDTITDQQASYVGHALRKTNFYWFNMMFKLLDPGVNHELMPDREVNGNTYKVVKMTFGEGVGEASDTFVLYINPKTYRVDQFLFTAVGFGMTEPSLMKLKYEKIDGVYISTHRKLAQADWDGNVTNEMWTEQLTSNVKFNNGFDLENIKNSSL